MNARKRVRSGIRDNDGPIKCPGHRKWVRGRNCELAGRSKKSDGEPHKCWGPIDFHHVTTRGAGGGDDTGIPLCRGAHSLLDSPWWSQTRVEDEYGVNFMTAANEYWLASPHGIKWRREHDGE